jgi:hypothetical protein
MSATQLVPQASTHGSFHREVAHLSAPKQCAEYVSFHGRLSRRRVGSVACAESARLLSDRYPSRPPAPMPTCASGPPRASPRGSRTAALRTLVESAYPTRLSDTGAPSGPGHIGILYFLLFQQRERGLARGHSCVLARERAAPDGPNGPARSHSSTASWRTFNAAVAFESATRTCASCASSSPTAICDTASSAWASRHPGESCLCCCCATIIATKSQMLKGRRNPIEVQEHGYLPRGFRVRSKV